MKHMIGFSSCAEGTRPDWPFFEDTVKWELHETNDGYKIAFFNPEGRRDYWYIGSVPARIFFDDDTHMDFDDEVRLADFLKKYVSKGYYDEIDEYDPLDDMDVL